MKKSKLLHILIKLFVVVSLLYIMYKTKFVSCEDYTSYTYTVAELSQDVYNELCKEVPEPSFLDVYGRSRQHPEFITRHYITVLSQPEFVKAFMDSISLADILKEHSSPSEALEKIQQLFESYVEKSIKDYEVPFRTIILFCVNINSTQIITAYIKAWHIITNSQWSETIKFVQWIIKFLAKK